MSGVERRGERDRAAFRFDARYGQLIRKAGIGTIPFALFHYQAELDLTPQEVWLVGYVLSHRWTSALPFPALREMARRSGVSTKTLEKYKKGLEHKGYLDVVRRTRRDGGNTSIGWDFSPLFEQIDRLITRDLDEWVRRNPQFLEHDDEGFSEVPGGPGGPGAPGEHDLHGAVVHGFPGGGEPVYYGGGERLSHGPPPTGRTRVEEESKHENQEEENRSRKDEGRSRTRGRSRAAPWTDKGIVGSTDSTGFTLARADSTAPPSTAGASPTSASAIPWARQAAPPSAAIDQLVAHFSEQLYDAPSSVRANCTRVRRLWAHSARSEAEFVQLLHEAYRRTQDNAHRIRKPAPDGRTNGRNKMPYFLSVLSALVTEADDAPRRPRQAPPGQ
ncbi:MAG TPA: hypothetical protein VHS99_23690 [Chloroflexota bacterium]|nr:hypothetical protein [Chloroflexota bacterium]